MEIAGRARKIKLLLMDCDGVLTDGRLYFGARGEELKVFHVRDGQGIVMWHEAGFRSGIISGRDSPTVNLRANQLGIEFVRQGVTDKAATLRDVMASAGVTADHVAFIGDDIPDIDAMQIAGFAVAVADAVSEVKAAAHHVTELNGGRGAVREAIDLILAAKG
ncbi:MAG: HAD hydrolase family protein [Pyrinomonadaceae bacterium]